MGIGKLIKKRRQEMGLTQEEVAKRLGVGQNYVAYLESDQRSPSHEILEKLSITLTLPFDELYFEAYPKVKEKFSGNDHDRVGLLRGLAKNLELRRCHQITDEEINLLASVQPLGKIKDVNDYVELLEAIRKVYR